MKTNTICLNLFGDPKNVERVCDQWKDDFETQQQATYTVSNGLATIIALTPVIKTVVNIPLPFVLPVNDLGSGILKRVEINCDTLRPLQATCPTTAWADRRRDLPAPTISQQLIADYCALH